MRKHIFILAMTAIVASAILAPVAALEKSRVIVLLAADKTESNDVLFDYAKTMDLGGIADLGDAYPKGIPFEELITRLPNALEGWEKGTSHGMSVGGATFASGPYTKGEAQVTIVIWDTMNLAEGPWTGSIPAGNVDAESTEGYVRYKAIEGYPSCEVRSYGEKSGMLIIALTALAAQPIPEAYWLAASLLLLPAVRRLKHGP